MYDVIVVGLGAMGSATLFHLAGRGARVLGLDRYSPPHSLGSSHGQSRIIREAYFEHPNYVPLVRRASQNWQSLEKLSGQTLFRRTGGLMMGAPDSGLIAGTLASAHQHDIAVTELDSAEIARLFPAFVPEKDMIGVLEHNAGVLDPERCVEAHLALARARGADVSTGTQVIAIESRGEHVRVVTNEATLDARRVVLAAGPWTRDLLRRSGTDMQLMIERQTMHWFAPARDHSLFDARHLPVTLIEHQRDRYVYFVPDLGHGVKAAVHYEGSFSEPDAADREIRDFDIAPVRKQLARFAPALSDPPHHSAVCLYTNTPDKHFVVDEMPKLPGTIVLSACSGHGFKFASAIGEAAASMALEQAPALDLSYFNAGRFS